MTPSWYPKPFENRIWPVSHAFYRSNSRRTKTSSDQTVRRCKAGRVSRCRFDIRSHPEFDPAFSEIIDCTGITNIDISIQFLQKMAAAQSIFNKGSKHIIIAPRDYHYGLARMTQMLAEPTKPNIVVVKTLAEVYEILGMKQA